MSNYAPPHRPWHNLIGECSCEAAWKDRGMIDDRCWYHRTIEAVDDLRDMEWTVEPPEVSDE